MGELIALLIIIGLYLGWMYICFVFILPLTVGVGLLLSSPIVIGCYVRAFWEGLRGTLSLPQDLEPTPPEPAYKNYFFRKAYLDIRDIWFHAWSLGRGTFQSFFEQGFKVCFNGEWNLFIWPFGIALGLIVVGIIVITCIIFGIFVLLHSLFVIFICIGIYFLALYLRTIEEISMVWRQAGFACPHRECYKHFRLPSYHCSNPHCDKSHEQLLPGSYGIFRRRCACNTLIPCSGLFGRDTLKAYCPHCSGELTSVIGKVRTIHIPLIGGRSTGKSTASTRFVTAVSELFQPPVRELILPVAEDRERFQFERTVLDSGGDLLATSNLSPRAFLMLLREPNRLRTLMYIYDAAGELYQKAEDERLQQYYLKHATGFLFLIDPFSLVAVRREYNTALSQDAAFTSRISQEPPQDVYDRFVTFIRSSVKYPQRIAVILTKVDAFDLQNQFHREGSSLEQRSHMVQQWLINNGEANLVESLKRDFKHVAYFTSALQGPGAVRDHVLDPVRWLLGSKKIIEPTPRYGLSWRSDVVAYSMSVLLATAIFLSIIGGAFTLGLSQMSSNPSLINSSFGLELPTTQSTASVATDSLDAYPKLTPSVIPYTATPVKRATPVSVTNERPSRVQLQDVNLRMRPGSEEPKLTILRRGVQVYVLDESEIVENNKWVRVKVGDLEGWVNQRYLAPVTDLSTNQRAQIIDVYPDHLLVRVDAALNSKVVDRLSEGAEVELLEVRKRDGIEWQHIRVDVTTGWVNSRFLKIIR